MKLIKLILFIKIISNSSLKRRHSKGEINDSEETVSKYSKENILNTSEEPLDLSKTSVSDARSTATDFNTDLFEYLEPILDNFWKDLFFYYNPSVVNLNAKIEDEQGKRRNFEAFLGKIYEAYIKTLNRKEVDFSLTIISSINQIFYRKKIDPNTLKIIDSFVLYYKYVNTEFSIPHFIFRNKFLFEKRFSVDDFLMFSFFPFENIINFFNTKCKILINSFCCQYYYHNKNKTKVEVKKDIENKTNLLIQLFTENNFTISDFVIYFYKHYKIKYKMKVDFYCLLQLLYLKCILNPEMSRKEENKNSREKNLFLSEAKIILLFYDLKNQRKEEFYFSQMFELFKTFAAELFIDSSSTNTELVQNKNELFSFINQNSSENMIFYLIDLQLKCQNTSSYGLKNTLFSDISEFWRSKTYFKLNNSD